MFLTFFVFGSLMSNSPLSIDSPCPDKPNCVSTLAVSDNHQIRPIFFKGAIDDAQAKLANILKSQSAELVSDDGNVWHYVFTSSIMKFKDDFFVRFDDQEKKIDLRSSSRKGYYDFGVNRKRVEKIRELFNR